LVRICQYNLSLKYLNKIPDAHNEEKSETFKMKCRI
jgi:hypothetical protein